MKIHNPNFDEIKEAKKERYEELAQKNHINAELEFKEVQKMADIIPFSQPVQVGHHSEKTDRNYRKKIDGKFRKSLDTEEKANHYDNKVQGMENNYAIRQDDPEAVKKLKEKLIKVEKSIEDVKQHNKKCNGIFLESKDYNDGCITIRDQVSDRGIAEVKDEKIIYYSKRPSKATIKLIEEFVKTGKQPQKQSPTEAEKKLPDWHLTNLGAEKRRIKKRIESIQVLEKLDDVDETINGIQIYTEDGRVRIKFDYKPSKETRTTLKRSGFRWSPFNQVWQGYIHQYIIDNAREIAKKEPSN